MGGLSTLWRDDAGITTIEMAMLLVVIAVAGIWAWQRFGSTVADSSMHSTRALFGGLSDGAVPTAEVMATD